MAKNRHEHMPQTGATRRTWIKTAAIIGGAAAADSVTPAILEAQAGRPASAEARAVRASFDNTCVVANAPDADHRRLLTL
jgi:hypothetical protein